MNKRTRKAIQAINDSVPKDLRERLMTEVYIAPDLRLQARETAQELRAEANAMEGGPEKETALKEVQRLQNIIDAGYYDQKELRVDPEVAKEIDAYVDAELDKAIAEGRIPHPKDDAEHKAFTRKLKQHEQRNRKVRVARAKAIADDKARGSEAD